MDRFFDRLGELVRGLLGGGEASDYDPLDADMQAAYEELDAYLRGEPAAGRARGEQGGFDRSGSRSAAGESAGSGGRTASGGRADFPGPEETLRGDFAALEVHFGADLAKVRSSYKGLLLKYHPDRFADDPEKQRLANEVTQRLNASYGRIERFYRSRRGRG